MSEEIQRALDNLRFDRMVKAFCLITPDNQVVESTLDTDTEQMVTQTISLYYGKISQLTVNTEQGLVIISKIANDWLLAVLFSSNLTLGIAVVKTKATLLALKELDLEIIRSPPLAEQPADTPAMPTDVVTPTPESPATATPITPAEPVPPVDLEPSPLPATTEPPPKIEVTTEAPTPPTPPPELRIGLTFVPRGGDALLAALDKGSPVGKSLFEKFGPSARDILFLVDGKRDVKTIAFLLGLPEYAIVEVIEFAMNQEIIAQDI